MKGQDVETSGSRTFVVNGSFGTSRKGVFAAGDAVSGPATIVQAVAQGNLVAVSVDHWLKTGEMTHPKFQTPRHDVPLTHNMDDFASARRPATPRLSVADREGSFNEVEVGLAEGTACAEAKRCLRCDLEWLDVMGIERPIPIR
jgi:NADPH-dependent glutamate synthase beta subunit-like oxidoreductase